MGKVGRGREARGNGPRCFGRGPIEKVSAGGNVFQNKFGVAVEVSTGNATDTVHRVLAERKAGKYIMDVALISSRENNQRLVPSEAVIPFAPLLIHPEVLDKSAWYGGRYWYSDKESKFAFIYHVSKEDKYETWYNTEKIKEAEVATIKKQADFALGRVRSNCQSSASARMDCSTPA